MAEGFCNWSSNTCLLKLISGAQESIDDIIRKFKRTYHRNGKYDLTSQVPYLSKLADHYKQKYEKSGDWTDCLKVCENQNLIK